MWKFCQQPYTLFWRARTWSLEWSWLHRKNGKDCTNPLPVMFILSLELGSLHLHFLSPQECPSYLSTGRSVVVFLHHIAGKPAILTGSVNSRHQVLGQVSSHSLHILFANWWPCWKVLAWRSPGDSHGLWQFTEPQLRTLNGGKDVDTWLSHSYVVLPQIVATKLEAHNCIAFLWML